MKGAAYEYTDWLDRVFNPGLAVRVWWELEAQGRFAEWEAAQEQRAYEADPGLVAAMEDAGWLLSVDYLEAARRLGRIVQRHKDLVRASLAAATADDLRAVERALMNEIGATLRAGAPVRPHGSFPWGEMEEL